ncbi:hypothetical protein ABT368_04960 [Streptomyces althioticus]|uniref:hypothetical protein n=1 Tax=Streptomyces althioticus TaxID=83380 RepID=UPI0018737E40|nr:hypothetical protein GCM10010243_11020 [Streptomyces matensis]
MPDVRDDEQRPRDITFHSTVRADRLRFTAPPRTAVRFPGTGERASLSRSDRTNLPDTVEPDVDYRDVTVHYRQETGMRKPRASASD